MRTPPLLAEFIQARATLGVALYMQGDLDGCLRESNTVLAKEPGFGPAWNNLALVWADKGDKAKAVECARKALDCGFDVDPKFLAELGL